MNGSIPSDWIRGEKREVPGNFHLPLTSEGVLWFLEQGRINLFAIVEKGIVAEGPRTLITHFESPSLFFPFLCTGRGIAMVAITECPCVLREIPLSEIETGLKNHPSVLHHWINQLALFFHKETVSSTDIRIGPSEEVLLEKGQSLSLARAIIPTEKQKIHWIQTLQADVEFLDYPSLVILPQSGPFPLTYNAWIRAKDKTGIQSLEPKDKWQEGLNLFHQILLDYFFERQKIEAEAAKVSFEKRTEEEKENVNRSLKEMATIIMPVEGLRAPRGLDPLFRACQIIGDFQQISFRPPESAAADIIPEEHPAPRVSRICEASGVRYRQVRLTPGWWKKDCGTLLGFRGPENNPVALIAKTPGRYEIIDPKTNQGEKCSAPLAADLSPIAFCFYPPFPDGLKTGKEIIHFYFKHNKREFGPLLIYSAIASIIALFPPVATALLFNHVIPDANLPLLWETGIALVLSVISSSLFFFFRSLMTVRIEGHSSNHIQLGLWDRILKLPVGFFRRYSTGNLFSRIMATEQIRSLLSGNGARVVLSGVFSLFYVITMLFYAPLLALIGVGVIVLSLLLSFICALKMSRMRIKILDLQNTMSGFLIQVITAVGKLRTTGAEKNALTRWSFQFAEKTRLELKSQNIQNLVTLANYALPFIAYACMFAFMIAHGSLLSPGNFLAFVAAFTSFYLAISELNNTMMLLVPVIPLWEQSRPIIEQPQEELMNKKKPGILTGEISIDDVTFKYEAEGPVILNNINLKVNPKEFIAIVGPSGSGKSTLIRLLLGFETPSTGGVYYDDQNLATLSIRDVRKQLGVVLQDEGIVSGSIHSNLVCGGLYTLEQIEYALEISGFKEDVDSFPMGLHTVLSMGGSTLSGGQKQRLLIARALLPRPKILIFDEATSALDNKNQKTVSDSLDRLDVTRIVIAHRLSTIRNADRIYVLERGKLVQSGTWEEVAAEKGLFADMLQRQKL